MILIVIWWTLLWNVHFATLSYFPKAIPHHIDTIPEDMIHLFPPTILLKYFHCILTINIYALFEWELYGIQRRIYIYYMYYKMLCCMHLQRVAGRCLVSWHLIMIYIRYSDQNFKHVGDIKLSVNNSCGKWRNSYGMKIKMMKVVSEQKKSLSKNSTRLIRQEKLWNIPLKFGYLWKCLCFCFFRFF